MRFARIIQAASLLAGFVFLGQFGQSFQPPAGAPGGPGAPGGQGKAAPPNPNAVSAIEFLIDPPTLINLGFEWFIQGDDNRNAAVTVSYRKKGETAWKDALPLLRLKGERVYMASQVDVIAPNMFAGSILDLEPDTAYEAQFVLADPDGVRGESRRTVTVRTRPEPMSGSSSALTRHILMQELRQKSGSDDGADYAAYFRKLPNGSSPWSGATMRHSAALGSGTQEALTIGRTFRINERFSF
ncbi:MAG: hypothetical protein ABI811_22865, partial [Acidobacteriota bacterium]